MRRALTAGMAAPGGSAAGPAPLALLPGLCCQAAGGQAQWADDLAVAWMSFYLAAHLMDSVEDQDEPDEWWAEVGTGGAINVASGLFFSAAHALEDLHANEYTCLVAGEVIRDFYSGFLGMCSGQHLDLSSPEPDLEQFWQIANAKSGSFFGLACWSGARLACDRPAELEAYRRFGLNLGLLVQIRDDLEDIYLLRGVLTARQLAQVRRSLPVIYAMEVAPPEKRRQIKDNLEASLQDPQASQKALRLIDQCGSALYIKIEIARHREQALAALEQAAPQPSAGELLATFLERRSAK
jgi:geranylgeranyl pyrophosphate synthase